MPLLELKRQQRALDSAKPEASRSFQPVSREQRRDAVLLSLPNLCLFTGPPGHHGERGRGAGGGKGRCIAPAREVPQGTPPPHPPFPATPLPILPSLQLPSSSSLPCNTPPPPCPPPLLPSSFPLLPSPPHHHLQRVAAPLPRPLAPKPHPPRPTLPAALNPEPLSSTRRLLPRLMPAARPPICPTRRRARRLLPRQATA